MSLDYATADLTAFTDSLILTKESRYEDWDTLGFQAKAGDQFRTVQIDYRGGLRYPRLERIPNTPDRLSAIYTAR